MIIIMINILLLQNLISLQKMFDLRLKQANIASQSDSANFVNKTDFNNKLKDVMSNKNELNELSKKIKEISTKGLTW